MNKNKSQSNSPLRQKLLLIVFGLFIALLLAEVFFRIGGLIAYKTMIDNNKVSDDADNVILCLGDSSTLGTGSSDNDKFSYPSQLQTILDNNTDMKFKVINLGIGGLNSSQLVNRLNKNILKYKADILIVQIGENDYHTVNESNIIKYYDVGFLKRVLLSTELLLNYSKVYRFFKLTYFSLNTGNAVYDNAFEDVEPDTKRTKGKIYRYHLTDPSSAIALASLIKDNFTKIVQISKDHNVKLIFMRYHIGGYSSIHFYQEQLFQQLGVPYINNRTLFIEAEKRGINPFGSDKWHPGDAGYLLIAKSIWNKMVSLGIVKGNLIEVFQLEKFQK